MTSPAVSGPEGIRESIDRGDKVVEIRLQAENAAKLAKILEAQRQGHDVAVVESAKEYTTTKAAKLLGISRAHLSRLIHEGKVRAHKVGTHHRITAREIESQQTMKKYRENPDAQKLAELWDEMGIDD
ncbi:hypothetical protein GCM10009720_20610 [Yaniella flava]|uniref:Helix-turn-helix domain-containing protein n=1 Tax=Yaniella flava TaxID=287930 RepID=A0ABN2UTI2_9MICC|nr:helix-turn-helix domain-containing protein [Micrococcaceae bacterium]